MSLRMAHGVTAEGRRVTEGIAEDQAQARELLEAGRQAGATLVWAHSDADLSGLGFRRCSGYRRMEGAAREDRRAADGDVRPLDPREDTAELCARAYGGQWGHKTPASWPLDLPPGMMALGLLRDGAIVGTCRVEPGLGIVDGPGLVPGHRDDESYRTLLVAALGMVRAGQVTVESWGDDPGRVKICAELGLRTTAYRHGWEFLLVG